MLHYLALIALSLTGAAGSTSKSVPEPLYSPFELFTRACTEGRIALPKGSAAVVEYRWLPRGAKRALGQSRLRQGRSNIGYEPEPRNVPNEVLAIGNDQSIFLLAPRSRIGEIASKIVDPEDFASSCMVVWRGDDFSGARELIAPGVANGFASLPGSSLPSRNALGIGYMSTKRDGLVLTAAANGGWIVLKAMPAPPAISGVP